MSGILGFVSLDGEPPQEQFGRMTAAMRRWSPNGLGTWTGMSAALAQLRLHTTPEALFEALPAPICGGTAHCVAAARLDNRDELCADLGFSASEKPTVPDGTLVARAFEKWGERCVDHLLGDWSFAVWNERDHSLFLARDHFGNTALHFCLTPRFFAFSSGIEALLALEGLSHELDAEHIAAQMMMWDRFPERTTYRHISRMVVGHHVKFQRGKLDVTQTQYWDAEATPPLKLGSDAEYVEAFLDIYRAAVRGRMRSNAPIASTLSAGLDSSTVTALAAEVYREEGRTLTAYTSVPLYQPDRFYQHDQHDEWPLAHLAAQHIGNVDHRRIDAVDLSPIAGLRKATADIHEPDYTGTGDYWIYSMMAQMQSRGERVLLTGQSGNGAASFDGGPFSVWGALRERQFGVAAQQFGSSAGRPPRLTRSALSEVVKPLLEMRAWNARQSPHFRPRVTIEEQFPHVAPGLFERLGLREAYRRADHLPALWRLNHRQTQAILIGVGATAPFSTMHASAAVNGLEVRDPTQDKRLVEFCRAIPLAQFHARGHRRYLMRRAAEGLLPPEMQWNTVKGAQLADLGHRLGANLPELDALLTALRQTPGLDRFLNLAYVERMAKTLSTSPRGNHFPLCSALAVGIGLQQTPHAH